MSRINSWLLILLAFSLPLSTSAITVTAILIMVCWLLEGGLREKWQEIITNPVCIAVFVFFGVMLIGLCWTDSFQDGLEAIRKRWPILLLPIFLTAICWEQRWRYVAAFIAGVTVTMLLIDCARFDLLHYAGLAFLGHLTIVSNHIVFTPMLALATYLLLHQLFWGGMKRAQRWAILALAVLMIFNIFITLGRSGQAAFFMLMALLLFQYFRRNVLKAVLLALILLPLVFTAAYRFSPVFHTRMDMVQQEIMTFEKNQDSSVGLRLLYWKNSWEIIRHSPWFGVGTGDFNSAYSRINGQTSPHIPSTDNPHNQYIFIAVQLGLFGLLSLLGLFGVQFYQAWQMRDGWQRIRLAFPLFFLVIMMTDSYLNTYSSGFLFSLFSAVLSKKSINWQGMVAFGPQRTALITSGESC